MVPVRGRPNVLHSEKLFLCDTLSTEPGEDKWKTKFTKIILQKWEENEEPVMFALNFVETLSRRGDSLRIRIKHKVYSQSKTDERTNLKQGWMKKGREM